MLGTDYSLKTRRHSQPTTSPPTKRKSKRRKRKNASSSDALRRSPGVFTVNRITARKIAGLRASIGKRMLCAEIHQSPSPLKKGTPPRKPYDRGKSSTPPPSSEKSTLGTRPYRPSDCEREIGQCKRRQKSSHCRSRLAPYTASACSSSSSL